MRATVRERWRLLLLLRAAPGRAAVLAVLGTVVAATPTSSALVTGLLVHALVRLRGGTGDVGAVAWALVAMAAILVADEVASVLQDAWEQQVASHIDGQVRAAVRRAALGPPRIAHLEDAGFQEDATRASEIGGGRVRSAGTAAVGQLRLVFRILSALAAAALIATLSPILAALVLLASLTMRAITRRQWTELARVRDERVGRQRRVAYWAEVAAGRPAAKEIRLFDLAGWSVGWRRREYLGWVVDIWATRRAILRQQGWSALLAFGSGFLALVVPGLVAVHGTIRPDQLVRYLVAARGVFVIGGMGFEAFDIEYGLGAVKAYDRLAVRPAEVTVPAGPPVRSGPVPIRFEGVSFRYPGAGRPVIDGLDLEIRPGEVLAVVGPNGAGKTTLIKLLAGLYQPTAGRVSVGGVELTSATVPEWRRRLTILFQDFVRYPAPVHDNVALAAPEYLDDRDGVARALRLAGAQEVVTGLPDGPDTVLSPETVGGTDLSGGQWQRVAIARTLFAVGHGRSTVVLDEPTAHLDVRAEADFYRRVVAGVPDATVVLISHRLSTVRHADRIVLLRNGCVVESGTHNELVRAGGGYARMFEVQASRFLSNADGGTTGAVGG
jgi:ATP-binding cassette subfamily B protein